MAHDVRVMVLAGNGINCEMETAHACKLGGASEVDITYLWDLASGETSLSGYDMLCLPGGFLDGDDLGSARATSIRIRNTTVGESRLFDQFEKFVADGGLAIGICNGFQLMVKLGLLPALGDELGSQQVTLTVNDSNRFEDRWVSLQADPESPCVFTRGLDKIQLPVRHGEGKLVSADKDTFEKLVDGRLISLKYIDPATGEPTEEYPLNPNGSPLGAAALTSPNGRLLGLMPHPEGFLHRTNHPQWTRRDLPEDGDGLALFKNAIRFIREEG
jgi:phosphoribosylformylglycinamidine synthase subunit PurQ / glutaminase